MLIFTLSMDEIAVTFFPHRQRQYFASRNLGPASAAASLQKLKNAVSSLIFAVSVGLIIIWYRIRTARSRRERSSGESFASISGVKWPRRSAILGQAVGQRGANITQ